MELKKLIRPEILNLAAYQVQEQRGFIKLDAMENPFSWPEEIKQAWLAQLATLEINRYPDATHHVLKAEVRAFFSVPDNAGILLGNGSDELIQMLLMAVAGSNRSILSVDPTFTMYRIIATTLGLNYHAVPLNSTDFTLDMPAMLAAIKRQQPAIVFLSYPNNPTGNNFVQKDLRQIIQCCAEFSGLVVIDEAYYAFTADSMLGDLGYIGGDSGVFDNLLVMRTLSKVGMAGLRFGMLMGPENILEQLNKIRLPYNVNALTQASIRFVMKTFDLFQAQVSRICEQRQWLFEQLSNQDSIQCVYPSEANFITFKMQDGTAESTFEALKSHKVLIKKLHGSSPMLNECLRVTIGTEDENKRFMQAFSAQ